MPTRNEARYIAQSVGAALAQDYPPDRMELIVADGMSTDGTQEIIESLMCQHANLRLIENPGRIVPTGLNAAIAHAQGEIIIRMDAHCEYPNDYVERVTSLLKETKADNVGGSLVAVGSTNYAQRAICAAYQSPLSVGGALRSHQQSFIREVDAVHGGCWRKTTLVSAGLFDEEMVRNQDDELSFRLRKKGGRIIQDSTIQVRYHVRDSFIKLFNQFLQYGYWKVRVIYKHPKQAKPRHFIPAVLVVTIVGLVQPDLRVGLSTLVIGYFGLIVAGALLEGVRSDWKLWPGIILVLAAMHLGYGVGFIIGVFRQVLGSFPSDTLFEQITR